MDRTQLKTLPALSILHMLFYDLDSARRLGGGATATKFLLHRVSDIGVLHFRWRSLESLFDIFRFG